MFYCDFLSLNIYCIIYVNAQISFNYTNAHLLNEFSIARNAIIMCVWYAQYFITGVLDDCHTPVLVTYGPFLESPENFSGPESRRS